MNTQKIPKVIHYCWFGKNPMNDLAKKCIQSWKRYLPDYELKLWNEETFDINSNKYTKEAYESKKWAFITDYVRLWALYKEGGIYLDTDVEILKPLDKFLNHGAFSGFETKRVIPTGIMGAQKGNEWIRFLLDYYNDRTFYDERGECILVPNTSTITEMSKNKGLKLNGKYQIIMDDVHLYPKDYFAPKSYITQELKMTSNTHCIHHFNGSWVDGEKSEKSSFKKHIARVIGDDNYLCLIDKKNKITNLMRK